ncbi:uncharacterized protein LOC143481628 isoform X2 [Brachyhypopomus gauderio]|uniref:uncharacterized protein LOC143481628 isoform X2 n=1 Tax=Brachyhypopomus gauderio TaxID=698409 RepID=UPI004041C45E
MENCSISDDDEYYEEPCGSVSEEVYEKLKMEKCSISEDDYEAPCYGSVPEEGGSIVRLIGRERTWSPARPRPFQEQWSPRAGLPSDPRMPAPAAGRGRPRTAPSQQRSTGLGEPEETEPPPSPRASSKAPAPQLPHKPPITHQGPPPTKEPRAVPAHKRPGEQANRHAGAPGRAPKPQGAPPLEQRSNHRGPARLQSSTCTVKDFSETKHHGNEDTEHYLKHCEVFIPELTERSSEVKNRNSYRFMCPHAGQFQCKLTNLVFKLEGKGEVMYRLVSWDIHLLDGLTRMQPIGPLYDIDSISGSISQLHLPHCEIMHEERKDQMAVAHFTEDNVEVIQPLQVTNTHVIIDVQGFSLFGLLFNKIFGSSPINGQVLLFYKEMTDRKRRKKLHMHLLPGNVPVDEVMNRHINFRNIPTSSKCQLIPGRKYRPFCKHTFQPEDETFDRDYGPNYHPTFEVFLDAVDEEITIGLLDKGGKQVWVPRLILLTDQCEPAQTIRDQSDTRQTTTAQSNPHQTITAQIDPGQTTTAQSDLDQIITAQSGGFVNAPALTSSMFNAPVNITFGDTSRHKGN